MSRRNTGSGRMTVVAVLVVALAAAGFARQAAWQRRYGSAAASAARGPASASPAAASSPNLANIDSFALALLLGGLRGPLVMVLWTGSESQKSQRDLNDFDTQVELIRLLQPEFDTVHMFQVWNKAYNISHQMSSVANKYSAILDAIDYALNVDRQRPDNINIIYTLGGTYAEKLGDSTEKAYYINRVRRETLPHASRQKLSRSDPGWRRIEHDVMLDGSGHLLPHLVEPRLQPPADYPAGAEWNDGSAMQYLKRYEPFPYGLSPRAIGYNYFKRAQVLQSVGKQKHMQVGAYAVDNRVAQAQRKWAEEEWERGRRFEVQLFGLEVPSERLDLELRAAAVGPQTPIGDRAFLDLALYSYDLAARLAKDTMAEYRRHLALFMEGTSTRNVNRDHVEMIELLSAADAAYLRAIMAPSADQRPAFARSADEKYRAALRQVHNIMLRYYLDPTTLSAIAPALMKDAGYEKLPLQQQEALIEAVRQQARLRQSDEWAQERFEYERYARRVSERLDQLVPMIPRATPTAG